MENLNSILGVLMVAFSVLSAYGYLRVYRGQSAPFRKLEPMRKFWGHRAGTAIHFTGYVLVPFIAGLVFLLGAE